MSSIFFSEALDDDLQKCLVCYRHQHVVGVRTQNNFVPALLQKINAPMRFQPFVPTRPENVIQRQVPTAFRLFQSVQRPVQ